MEEAFNSDNTALDAFFKTYTAKGTITQTPSYSCKEAPCMIPTPYYSCDVLKESDKLLLRNAPDKDKG